MNTITEYIKNREEEFDKNFHYQNGVELLLKSPNHFQTYDVTKGIKSFHHDTIDGVLERVREVVESKKKLDSHDRESLKEEDFWHGYYNQALSDILFSLTSNQEI